MRATGGGTLVVMLEFQSDVDYGMALRIRNYVDNFHMERWRGRSLRRRNRLAPVLPIVLYRGKPRWTAPLRVIDFAPLREVMFRWVQHLIARFGNGAG